MTKKEIIEKLAEKKTIENLIKKHSDFLNNPYIEDLCQDIYILLYEKDEDLLNKLYDNNEFEYYITKIIKNNLYSNNSQFFYKYQKFRKITDEIEETFDEKY